MATHRIGSAAVTPVLDGTGREQAREVLFRHGSPQAWDEHDHLLDDAGDLHLSLGGYLVCTQGRVALVDAGVGTLDNGRYQGGAFLYSLRSAGVSPEDVTDVLFTHLHFDHVGWATKRGRPVFPNATYHAHAADWEHFVTADDALPGAVRKLAPLQPRMSTFDGATTLLPGLDARPAPGHSPGTTVYVVSGGGERLFLVGDLAHCEVELTETGWAFAHDWQPELATTAREELVAEVVDTSAIVAPGHAPDLAPGRLARHGDRVAWRPV